MESIIDILHKGGYSCVMKNREEVRTFTQRGVADLYDLYQADSAFMKGAAIADKVIGKGAAALMVLGGFKTVYADIISTPALALLCEAGIETTFAQEVPHIIIIRKSKNPAKPKRKVQNPAKIGENHNSKRLLKYKSRNIGMIKKSIGSQANPMLFFAY